MNIDYKKLKRVCLADIDEFTSIGQVTETRDGIYIYKDNNASVLGVAHLDSVLDLDHFHVVPVNKDEIVLNAQLDDRLGVYTLLYTLPSMGIKFDLLLTEGEETGRSTAAHFETKKQYNWVFSFDRRGEGCVLYQYSGKEWEAALKASGFKIDMGSFSDISMIEHLGVKCVNIGTGYHGEHDDTCYASMGELNRQVKKFADFYAHNRDIKYKHTKGNSWGWGGGIFSRFQNHYDDYMCYLCNGRTGTVQVMEGVWVCKKCFNDADMCTVCDDIVYAHELTDGVCKECMTAAADD